MAVPVSNTPDVSILLCTRNRAAFLRETLSSLAGVQVPDGLSCELLVIDNGSTDDTAQVVQDAFLPQMPLRYIVEARRGQAHARNTGMAEARGQFFLWTDDDVRPPADWIPRMLAPLLSGTADGVAGGIRMAPHLRRPWMEPFHHSLLASTEQLAAPELSVMLGANMAFRRDVLRTVPAYDPELGPGALGFYDDSLFSMQITRAGLTILSALDVTVEHHFDPSRLTRASFLHTARAVGRSQAYMAWHWYHGTLEEDAATFPLSSLAAPGWPILRIALEVAKWRVRRPTKWRIGEGGATWEMDKVRQIAFYQQYLRERERPRRYDRLGLRLREPAPARDSVA